MAAGLTVGDFSLATHLSVKTLRHYHQVGLLEPAAVIPAAELAIISHHCSLADADLSYAKLGSYATTHEISIDEPPREYYLRGAADTPDEAEWRTEIGWPIFRADASRA
jgi:hypothetical protein